MARKEVEEEVAELVLGRLDRAGLIDDEAFAHEWVASRHNHRGLSKRALADELRRKGVDGSVAAEAVAIARGYVAPAGIDLVCVPTFADIEIDGERRTAIRLSIEDRSRSGAAPAPPSVDGDGRAPVPTGPVQFTN